MSSRLRGQVTYVRPRFLGQNADPRGRALFAAYAFKITGWENMPPPPVLIASRHESTFDVLIWIALLPAACFVVKRELARIPLFGRCILATGMIVVDREAGGAAIRTLLRGGDRAKAEGRHIVIFPEGTRVAILTITIAESAALAWRLWPREPGFPWCPS